jgi:predicted nucleotidyltransferase
MELVGTLEKFPDIKEMLKKAIHRIVQNIDPLKIILFGSYAYGDPSLESDIDLLVIIKESSEPKYKRVAGLNRVLKGLNFPRDILVYTQAELDEWSDVPLAFITTILQKGKVLYEKR